MTTINIAPDANIRITHGEDENVVTLYCDTNFIDLTAEQARALAHILTVHAAGADPTTFPQEITG